jgi:hypothetical protein
MIDPPSSEPRNAIERAAEAALDAFRDALPPGSSVEVEDGHLILLARGPGLKPDAISAGADGPEDLLHLLLHHAQAVSIAIGDPIQVIQVNQG